MRSYIIPLDVQMVVEKDGVQIIKPAEPQRRLFAIEVPEAALIGRERHPSYGTELLRLRVKPDEIWLVKEADVIPLEDD